MNLLCNTNGCIRCSERGAGFNEVQTNYFCEIMVLVAGKLILRFPITCWFLSMHRNFAFEKMNQRDRFVVGSRSNAISAMRRASNVLDSLKENRKGASEGCRQLRVYVFGADVMPRVYPENRMHMVYVRVRKVSRLSRHALCQPAKLKKHAHSCQFESFCLFRARTLLAISLRWRKQNNIFLSFPFEK